MSAANKLIGAGVVGSVLAGLCLYRARHARRRSDEGSAENAVKCVILDVDLMLLHEPPLPTPNQATTEKKPPVLIAGVDRFVSHLAAHNVPLICAARSSGRGDLDQLKELSPSLTHWPAGWVHGDSQEAANEGLLQMACDLLGTSPRECLLVTAGSSSIVLEAEDLGCRQVAVPPKKDDREACESSTQGSMVLHSLLDLKPELFKLPPFEDWTHDVLPLPEVVCFKGPVVKGFGRGSKMLGIPTANLDASSLPNLLGLASGIYAGWAGVGGSSEVHLMVMSVGWNPYFNNDTKSIEPWLLHEFPQDFYGEELRLVVNCYLRPEANFTTLEALVDRIHEDAAVTKGALLKHNGLNAHKKHPFLTPA